MYSKLVALTYVYKLHRARCDGYVNVTLTTGV